MSIFESTLLNFFKPQSKLGLQMLRHGSRERKIAKDKNKNMTLAWKRNQAHN